MKKIIFIFILLLIPLSTYSLEPPKGGSPNDTPREESSYTTECVVLLHGLGRTKLSMKPMEKYLIKQGYAVVNSDYTTRGKDFTELVEGDVDKAVIECMSKSPAKVHFVTHSLGGILVRHYLQNSTITAMGGRVVMLAPPNNGSELSDIGKKYIPLYDWFLGPVGSRLGINSDDPLHNVEPLVGVDVGIIAGNGSLNPWYSYLVSGEDDGKVSLESAKLKEMKDFIVVKSSHSFIMNRTTVKEQTVAFLKNGYFKRDLIGEPISYGDDPNDACTFLKDGTYEDYDREVLCPCCRNFDEAYYKGGTLEEKAQVDKDFRECVIDVTGCILTVERVFGDLKNPTPITAAFKSEDYKWGYGWTGTRLPNPLNSDELALVEEKLGLISRSSCEKLTK